MNKLLVVSVPGLDDNQLGAATPYLSSIPHRGTVQPVFPAVTMPAHAAMTTGLTPAGSGIVANGWFERDHNEVVMWRQSERLVQGPRIWDRVRDRHSGFKCLKHFWWPGMASTADLCVNVRPVYFADGRKSGDVYANDPAIADALRSRFGPFPLFNFWGPATSIAASQWIADSAIFLLENQQPDLALVYLPHLDYNQQRHGPQHPSVTSDLTEIDAVLGHLATAVAKLDYQLLVVSEYHMNRVDQPVHLNRLLRQQGWLTVSTNAAGELIDYGTSRAFAVADHQTAQVYVNDPAIMDEVRVLLAEHPHVDQVWAGDERAAIGLDHPRAGDVVVAAKPNAWFTYYYWLDDARAPDFARTVAIHAKPGYDPCEMFMDPKICCPKLRLAGKVIAKSLGQRTLFDFCPLDASLVRGSHGLLPSADGPRPLALASTPLPQDTISATDLPDLMLQLLGQ